MRVLALHKAREEASDICVTGTVRIHELARGQLDDRILLCLSTDDHNCWVSTLCDHHCAGRLALLRQGSQLQSDGLRVRLRPAFRLGKSGGLSFISKEKVDVRQQLHESCLERWDFHEKWCAQIQAVGLSLLVAMRCSNLHGVRGHCHEEACAIYCLCLVQNVHTLLQMADLVVVGGCQISYQRSLFAQDAACTSSSGCALINHVDTIDSILCHYLLELVPVGILANASHVIGGILLLHHPLGYADRVLGGTTCNVLHSWLFG
mmetsp:Transcript_39556/g.74209  ORF Transcript_39556/g.74209 Transcript_39556/m.74209 type:complete len:263 (-) Transcript_39556:223-1011(-)